MSKIIKHHQYKILLIITALLAVMFFVILSVHIYSLVKFKADTERAISSGENITEVPDATDIKRRMEYHGCLVCWKDSTGVWWFHRDNKQYKLWSPKQ